MVIAVCVLLDSRVEFVRKVSTSIYTNYTIYTNVRLAKIGYVPKDTCTFCEVDSETVLHLFYECPFTNLFLKKFEDYWFALSNEHEELLQQDVFIGKLGKSDLLNYFIILAKFHIWSGKLGKSDLLNYFIILAKFHIWSSRLCSKRPNFYVFKEMVDLKYRTEKYIALKNNTERKFQAKWQVYINNRSKVYL